MSTLPPVVLPANQPADRFYRGGPGITAFRGPGGGGSDGDHVPEDWVASVTTQAGETSVGLTTLPDGRLLRDAVAGDPVAWLGQAHVDAFGPDPLLLVKLLDPGQRLPVHVHPDDAWAAEHLGHAHGKAEAWCILEPGEVWVGLTSSITPERLLDLVESQSTEALLGLLHRRAVAAGDTVYVPPGVLHAIGEGVVLAEVQQPEDLSILLEWRGFDLDGTTDGHLAVGFPTAVGALELAARSDAEVDALITRGATDGPILAPESARYFRAERYAVDGERDLEQGYAVLIVLGGDVELATDAGSLDLAAGATVLIPFAGGRPVLTGSGSVLLFRPPAPGASA
jgi:mannose-6-phosphate isomerase